MSFLDVIKEWFGGASDVVQGHAENLQDKVNTEELQQKVEDTTKQVSEQAGQVSEQVGEKVNEVKDKLTGQQ